MDEKGGSKVAIYIGICAAVIFAVWFIFMSSSAEAKYGAKAVEDAQAAIFTADQYLDGNLSEFEYEIQILAYSKNVEISEKSYEIYRTIRFMENVTTDARILKYRNELAELIGEKKK